MTKLKYTGSPEELETELKAEGVKGNLVKKSDTLWQYKDHRGGILNFYPSNGTIFFQGSEVGKLDLEDHIYKLARKKIRYEDFTHWLLKE